MMHTPLVSVIIPNYCHAEYLDQRLQTVLGQTYKNFEVIILDDASTDNGASKSVIEKYREDPHVTHIIYNETNSGSTFIQWQKGFELAKGELIWIAESDDYSDLNFLENLVPCFEKYPSCSVVHSARYLIDEKGDELPWFRMAHDGQIHYTKGIDFIRYQMACDGTAIPNASGVLFRKNVAMSLSKDYMQYKSAGDRLFWIMMLEQGDICYVDKQLNFFRIHTNNVRSKTGSDGTQCRENYRISQYLHQKGHLDTLMKVQEKIYYWDQIHKQTYDTPKIKRELLHLWFPGWRNSILYYYALQKFKALYLLAYKMLHK